MATIKNVTKRTLSVLLTMVMLLSVFMSVPITANAVNVTYSFEEDSIRYLDLDDSTVSVVGFNLETMPEDVVIPSQVQGKTVTEIGEYAFSGTRMKSIVLPKSITSIKTDFDFLRTIESITMQCNVTSFDKYMFENCTALKEIYLPDTLLYLPERAFSGCTSLESIHLPENLVSVGYEAFVECTSLKEVIINPALKSIAFAAFEGDSSLTNVIFEERTIPISVGDYAFEGCSNLADFDFAYCKNIGYRSFRGCKSLTSFVMSDYPDATLESYAFGGCTNLKTVKLNENIREIPSDCFVGCKSLESIETGNITSVGREAFAGCEKLKNISFAKNNDIHEVDSGAFSNCHSLTEISLSDAVYIYEEAFEKCYNLRKVSTSKNLEFVRRGAFFDCDMLEEISLVNVDAIGESAFENCYSLKKVTVGEKLQWIGKRAFYNCVSLPEFYIPEKVEKIGEYAFACFDYDKKVYVATDFVVRGSENSLADEYADVYQVKWGLPAPVLKSVSNVKAGIKVSFKKVAGATGKYRVYRKTSGTSWKKIADVTGSSYTDTAVKVGTKYTYTVKLITSKETSPYDTKGLSVVRLSTPEISKVTNVNDGMKISWNKSSGASSYVAYVKHGDDWEEIGTTSSTSITFKGFENRPLVPGKTYKFTLKSVDSSGKYKSGCITAGFKNKFVAPPQISKLSNTETGVKITWDKAEGAVKYRVFVKSGSKWKKLKDTTSTSYTHTSVESGKTYTYTVRCISESGKSYQSGYDSKGTTTMFLATPQVKKISNTVDGAKITWNGVNGAYRYNVYAKSGSSWKKIGESYTTSFIHESAKSGTTYTYRVRAYDETTEFSSYYKTSAKNKFISAPVISSLTAVDSGVKITWDKVDGAAKYRVFIKSGSKWKKLKDTTSTSFVHKNDHSEKSYTYTVRCISESGKSYTSGYDKIGRTYFFE